MKYSNIFDRHSNLWGEEKMNKVRNASLFIAGIGGLGTTLSQILVRSGIGKLYIMDNGIIDEPDLNRQSLYSILDIGKKKVEVAKKKLKKFNDSQTEIISYNNIIDENLNLPDDILGVVDCLDNYKSRFYLENALSDGKFYIHGGIMMDFGQVISLIKGKSKSLKDIFANYSESTNTIEVSPDIVFSISSIMVRETLNHIWKEPKLLNTFLIVEFSDFKISRIKI
ncbi:MAG: HesA/MoeB/ThiF family protein [Spirochaetota bacterium]